jgi:hypothetical protein
VPLLAAESVDTSWDSIRLVFRVAAFVAVAGSGLLALPPRLQRLALSLLLLVHFGGITAAIFSFPPPDAEASWLALQLKAKAYNPYLEFLYLNNSYGFYSQGDQPSRLLWFHITYADGQHRWIKVPEVGDGRVDLAGLRLGGLAWEVRPNDPPDVSEASLAARVAAGKRFDPPNPEPGADTGQEYHEPSPAAQSVLTSFARHVARSYPHPTDPARAVTGVRIYLVVHNFLTPYDLRAGCDPADPTTYYAYYQGDFGPDGRLKPSCLKVIPRANGEMEVRQAPLLYWHLPIVGAEDGSIVDYVKLHAESRD